MTSVLVDLVFVAWGVASAGNCGAIIRIVVIVFMFMLQKAPVSVNKLLG